MDSVLLLAIIVILLALAFDFINGMHDTANAIATCVSTRVLSPRQAIFLSVALNFLGAFLSTAVAKTIGKGIVDPEIVTSLVLISALVGAIVWNMITWAYGLPSSSSHALIGGLIGAVIQGHGLEHLQANGLIKIVTSLIVSPLLGGLVGFLLMVSILWLFRNAVPGKVNRGFKFMQMASASFMAFSHGSNDAQKSMGIIVMALVAAGLAPAGEFHVPFWVVFVCAFAMAAGTSTGGWRIIKTMGTQMIKLTPVQGFAAEASASAVILTATHFGAPVSTTHVISSSIMGVGASKRLNAVRWGVAGRMFIAWILTIPASALMAMVVSAIIHLFD